MPEGDRYVEVPAEALFSFLAGKGFERSTMRREVVFVRRHHADPRYSVLVYTSVREGASSARKLGADAIRVCAIFTPGNLRERPRGVAKLPKVLRTGSVEAVLERVLGRMREAYSVCNRRAAPTRVGAGRN